MRRIDPQTVRKILDTADIVEVVSDFVNLKRRGQNYVGLCPFHNERTPSFSVSKARGICKCFSCGKGGNTVNFIMEIEQLSYGEALRWLAKKYNIEIEEQELTPEQLAAASRRESMLALNDFALEHFQHNLTDHPDGQAIGLAYFRARGITDAAIKRFRLGYALEQRDALVSAARAKGYSDDLLAENGLCIRTEHGSLYDRFRGRVIYPVFALSGKVLAFGGRTLRKDKDVAKYVNSPESIIYSKSRELYGMYQARRAIVQQDKCILVEGYMDVISMSQRGIENVVASSGTSLTEGQIAMIHRFTNNVTVVYDSDAAGIKASLRGIDMLLAEGLNIKVMLLPEGDDPDSFAQSHTLEEIQAYMAENETDFLRFKAQVLLSAVKENDPMGRAHVINDMVRSISVIADEVVRNEYIKECSRMLDVGESTLARQVAKQRAETAANGGRKPAAHTPQTADEGAEPVPSVIERSTSGAAAHDVAAYMRPYEMETLRLALRYGLIPLTETVGDDGSAGQTIDVLQYIDGELRADGITFANADLATIFNAVMALRELWPDVAAAQQQVIDAEAKRLADQGFEEICAQATSLPQTQKLEAELQERIDLYKHTAMLDYAERYVVRELSAIDDPASRRIISNLVSERYVLSRIHTKHARVEQERDCLTDRVPKAVYGWKNAVLEWREKQLRAELAQAVAAADNQRVTDIMSRQLQTRQLINELAKYLGERIVLPRK
jgi:DNA primase